jgi:hypothetical protein
VVLPVYNGAEHLRESIDSILAQTHADLELVIVDDASTDDSLAIARATDDPRVRIVALDRNGGLAAALNAGIDAARAPVIARQDQDDLAAPDRLARQLVVLADDPGTILVGTWARIVRPDGAGGWEASGQHHHPVADDELRLRLLWNNPFVHSSVAFRRAAFEQAGRYRTDPLSWPEDYDLWVRMAPLGRLANVPAELVTYRQTSGGMSDAYRERISDGVQRIASRNLALVSGLAADDATIVAIARVLNGLPQGKASASEAWHRVRVFLSASHKAAPGGSPRLLAVRGRWAGKLAIRSVAPGWGTLDAA